MRRVGKRFIALACTLVLVLSMVFTLSSCVTTGGQQQMAAMGIEDFLAKHELVVKLGTEVAVMEILKRKPTAEMMIVRLADMLAKTNIPAVKASTLKNVVMKSIDMTQFSLEEQILVGILLDEAINQIEIQRINYCKANQTSLVCLDQDAWVKTGQTYAHKLSEWLKLGISMYHQTLAIQ